MRRDFLIQCLRKIDFKVNRQGVVKGPNDLTFGIVQNSSIRLMDGRSIPFVAVENIEFSGQTNTLQLMDTEGAMVCDIPGVAEDVDGVIIESEKMPETDSELNDVFLTLYPDAYDKLYYDVLDEREMVDLSLFGQKGGVVPLTDIVENIYLDHIERRLKAEGFVGKRPPSVDVRRRVLMTQIHKHERNRFRDWVESLTWDGKPRIATWFKQVFKAYAPPLKELGLEDIYLAKVAEAWFIGGIKRMYSKTQHDVVPVLIGGQGVGKSSGLEFTAGPGDWFAATTINISVPGGVARFLDSIRGKIVVELAEATTIRSADQEALKAFISKTEDQYRKPYAHYEERFPRHFIMAASTNIAHLFTDITGNRRFYPIYCGTVTEEEKKTLRVKSDAEQVWAEALALYRQSQEAGDEKHVWYIHSTWRPAVIMQRYCTQDNLNISVIDDFLDNPANCLTEIGARITRREILNNCYGLDLNRPIPKDCTVAYRAWSNSTTNWVDVQKRIDGKPTRLWERVKSPGSDYIYDAEEIDKEIKEMIKEEKATENKYDNDNIVRMLRERVAKYGLVEMDEFPIDGLDEKCINKLMDEGYIYIHIFSPKWNKCVYKIVVIP